MSRSGAKRRWKGTTPGRQNVRRVTDDQLMALQPHRRGLRDPMSPDAESMLGQLYLSGALDHPWDRDVAWRRLEAGKRYATVTRAYLSSIQSPKDCLPGGKGYACKGDPQCGQDKSLPPCECRKRKTAYNEAFEALAEAGHRAQVQVAHVAVHDKPCGDVRALIAGLDALALQLLTESRKNAKS